MRKGKIFVATVAASALALGLAGCSGGSGSDAGGSADGGSIDVFMNMPTGSPQEAKIKELTAKFESETNSKVNPTIASSSFEDDMKVKMASDSVPDVFSTHGWSVNRYSPYLRPLNDRPWAEYVSKGLDKVMYDADGNIYALPLEYSTTGLLVNYEILDKVGVDPDSLKTWDDVDAAMQKIKDELNISPITASGKESNAGDIGNYIASGAFTPEQNEAFKNGDFSTELWAQGVTSHVQKWQEKGFFNPDYVSATLDDMSRQLADNTAAFAISWPFVLSTAYEYNPDANLGFMPMPGVDGPYMVGGEGVSAFGVSKTSQNEELALKYVDFLAQPENAKPFLEAMGAYAGLTNVEVDLGNLQPSFDKYVAPGEIPTMPFFDRLYLPNGMWNTIITTTDGVINGQMTAEVAAQQMADQYQTLYSQQK